MTRSVALLACLTALLTACKPEASTPPPLPATKPAATPTTPAPAPAKAESAPAAPAAPTAPPAPAANTPTPAGTTPAADALDTFRLDPATGKKTISDMQILQQAVDGYNTTRVNLLEPDSKPGPELNDLTDLVKYRRLPKLPAAPAGKKYSLDKKTQKVILVNE